LPPCETEEHYYVIFDSRSEETIENQVTQQSHLATCTLLRLTACTTPKFIRRLSMPSWYRNGSRQWCRRRQATSPALMDSLMTIKGLGTQSFGLYCRSKCRSWLPSPRSSRSTLHLDSARESSPALISRRVTVPLSCHLAPIHKPKCRSRPDWGAGLGQTIEAFHSTRRMRSPVCNLGNATRLPDLRFHTPLLALFHRQ
jgi:hypothetical protein